MRRLLRCGVVLGVLAWATVAAAYPAPSGWQRAGEVAIFYYPWYGTPARDGAWLHWSQNGVVPPGGVASGFFPARGAYSSSDRSILARHMGEIASTGVDTVVVSWWGATPAEDGRLAGVARQARVRGLRVAVHVEPYGDRSPASVAADVQRLQALGIDDFYVYDSTRYEDSAWAAALEPLRGVRVFANTGMPGKAKAGGFQGLYTYDVLVYDGSSFPRMCDSARRLGLLCAPSVGPGFDARRATGESRVRPRAEGATYDRMWRAALRAAADVVTITSYNEWHEGTQIEPARPQPGYEGYDGAWGLRGPAAEGASLGRTAQWVDRYGARMAQYRAAARRLR